MDKLTPEEVAVGRAWRRLERKVVTDEVAAQADAGLYTWDAVEDYVLQQVADSFGMFPHEVDDIVSAYLWQEGRLFLDNGGVYK
jgi:hypothetical protein